MLKNNYHTAYKIISKMESRIGPASLSQFEAKFKMAFDRK